MRPHGFKDPAFLPSVPLPPVTLWLKADAGTFTTSAMSTPATADGDRVGGWQDQSGNGRHATQATGAARGTLKTNIQNGLPVVRLDGSDDFLAGSIDAQAAQTWLAVCQKRSAVGASAKSVFCLHLPAKTGAVLTDSAVSSGFTYYVDDANNPVAVGGSPTSWNVVALRLSSDSSAKIWVGGGAGVSFDPADFSAATFYGVGTANAVSGNLFGDFDVGELKRYSSALTLNELDAAASILAGRWGLSWSAAS